MTESIDVVAHQEIDLNPQENNMRAEKTEYDNKISRFVSWKGVVMYGICSSLANHFAG